jgi:NNP family nitrate/nitrite transporter-like MFS transporter
MPTPAAGDPRSLELRGGLPFPLPPVLFLVVIFYLNFTSRVILAPLLPIMERELGLGHGEAGSLFFLLQIGYCAGLLASAFISCRWNHRRTILLSTTTLGLILLAMSRSTSIGVIRAGLVLLGTAAGLYLPAALATITSLVSREHWGKALAIHELAPNLGYITAPLLAEALLRAVPWRGILAVLGLLAVLMGGCFLLFGRGGAHRPEPPRFKTMGQLARDPALWITAMLFSVSIGSSLGVYTMMPLFLVSEIGIEREVANTITGLSRVPGVVVIFISGMITDRIGHRRALALILATIGLLTLLLGLVHGPVTTSLLVFPQAAAGACFFPAGFAMVSLIFPPGLRSLAVSMVTIVGSLFGGGVVPPAIGYLAEVSSFSAGLCLLGLLTLATLPLLRYGTPSRIEDGATERTGEL